MSKEKRFQCKLIISVKFLRRRGKLSIHCFNKQCKWSRDTVFLEGLLVFVDRDGHGYQCVGFYTIHIQTRIQNNYPNLTGYGYSNLNSTQML